MTHLQKYLEANTRRVAAFVADYRDNVDSAEAYDRAEQEMRTAWSEMTEQEKRKARSARRLARLNLLRARIMRRALERNRLTARQKPGGQRRAARAHAAMMRIDQLLTREYIAAMQAEKQPIR